MHEDVILPIAIVGIVMLTGMVISVFALIARAIGRRGVGRRELQELRKDISHIKSQIDDMKEQLADIVIRLG
jgi:hypothetical protein